MCAGCGRNGFGVHHRYIGGRHGSDHECGPVNEVASDNGDHCPTAGLSMARAHGARRNCATETVSVDRECAVPTRAKPELPIGVVAPAPDASARRQRARVESTRSDRRHAAGQAAHRRRHRSASRRPVPDLPIGVFAPSRARRRRSSTRTYGPRLLRSPPRRWPGRSPRPGSGVAKPSRSRVAPGNWSPSTGRPRSLLARTCETLPLRFAPRRPPTRSPVSAPTGRSSSRRRAGPRSCSPSTDASARRQRASMVLAPAAIAATPLARPLTAVGSVRLLVVPSPSWPMELSPQHRTPPPVVNAQVWLHPP